MTILFTVCGRAGSKGVKNKNVREYLGTPLVYYTLATIDLYIKRYLTPSDKFNAVLNTDSPELIGLINAQKKLDVTVFERSAELGADAVPKVSVIADCLIRAEKTFGRKYDVVVDLDITSPLRTVEDLKNLIDKKLSRNDTDVVYSVTGSRRNPYFNMVIEEKGYFRRAIISEFTARQQTPVMYDMNASLYAYSPIALKTKDHKAFFNSRTDAIAMKDTAVLDIDSEEDFELISVIGKYFFENYLEFSEIKKDAESFIA